MSLNNKHLLAVAIAGTLASISAQAQVTLGTPATAATYASEVTVPANTTLANPGALTINTRVGFAFSAGEQRNARLECSPNIRFNGAAISTAAAANVGPVNGLGTNAISFSLTATAAVNIADAVTITPGAASGITLISRANASCTYGLYDTASQAANGGTLGLINQSTTSGAYIQFATTPSYALTATGANATAALGTPPYITFIPGGSGTGSIAAGSAPLGNITYGLVTPARLNTDGTPITLAALLSTTSTTGSAHVLSGNFAALADTAGAYSPTGGAGFGSVFLAIGGTCSAPGATVFPTTLNATTATFRAAAIITADVPSAFVCFVPRTGASIPAAGPYTFGFNAVSANTAVYTVTNIAPINIGTISREGAQLVAPLAQIPAGWTSRIVLNNTGAPATYTVTLTPGTGAGTESTSTFSGATTTASANLVTGTTVISVGDLFPNSGFTGAPRGTLTVTANTPRANVNGVYQIVNGQTGSISNYVMVAPGTN